MLDPTYRPPPPPRREPVFNVPRSILLILVALAAIHGLRQVLPERQAEMLFFRLAFEPGTVTQALDPGWVTEAVDRLAASGPEGADRAEFARFVLEHYGFQPWTALTYGLLHADWSHLGLNAIWLLTFGSPVARRLGGTRLLVFLGGAALAGAALHWLTHLTDMQPVIGASAAVSGCMGAAARFMFQPKSAFADMLLDRPDAPETRPALSWTAMARDPRVLAFVGVWFATNLLFGLGAQPFGLSGGPVAWEAHVGGFLFGIGALTAFEQRRGRGARIDAS